MASTGSVILEILHVVGAAVVVGYFALVPMWKASAKRSADPGAMRHFLASAQDVERRVVLPALGLLILTGLGLTLGPFATALLIVRWTQAGLVLGLVIGVLLVVGLGAPAKKMLDLMDKGEGTGPAMDKLWGEWRTSLLAAAVLALVATGMMVYQGSL